MTENDSGQFKEPLGEADETQETNRLVDSLGHHVGQFLSSNRLEEETIEYVNLDHLQKGLEVAVLLDERVDSKDIKDLIEVLRSIEVNSKRDNEKLERIHSLSDKLYIIKNE